MSNIGYQVYMRCALNLIDLNKCLEQLDLKISKK